MCEYEFSISCLFDAHKSIYIVIFLLVSVAFPTVMVNIWHVLVAVVVMQVIGHLWYGPLFGKTWMKLSGVKKPNMAAGKMARIIVTALVMNIISVYILAHFVGYADASSFADVASLTGWLWLGFMVPIQLGKILWEGKSVKLLILNAAYDIIALTAAAYTLVRLA